MPDSIKNFPNILDASLGNRSTSSIIMYLKPLDLNICPKFLILPIVAKVTVPIRRLSKLAEYIAPLPPKPLNLS